MRHEFNERYIKENYDIRKYDLVATKAVVASQLMELENARIKIDELNRRIKELEHFSQKDKIAVGTLEKISKERDHANGIAIKLRHRVQELNTMVDTMRKDIEALKETHPKALVAQLELAKNDVIKLENEKREQEKEFRIKLDAANVEILEIKMQLSKCLSVKKPLERHGSFSNEKKEEPHDNNQLVLFDKSKQFPPNTSLYDENLKKHNLAIEMENTHLKKELELKNSLLKSLAKQIVESRTRQASIEAKLRMFREKANKKFHIIANQNMELKKVAFQAAERASALSKKLLKSESENNVLKKELSNYVLQLLNDTKPIPTKKVKEDVRRIQTKVPSMIEFVEICDNVKGNVALVPQVIECKYSDDDAHGKRVKCIHSSFSGVECVPVLSEDRDLLESSESSYVESMKTYWDASISTRDMPEIRK